MEQKSGEKPEANGNSYLTSCHVISEGVENCDISSWKGGQSITAICQHQADLSQSLKANPPV